MGKPDIQAVQALAQAHSRRRAVRAVAQLGSLATPLEWAGTQARLLVFERGAQVQGLDTSAALLSQEAQVSLVAFEVAFEALEALLLAHNPQQPEQWLSACMRFAATWSLPANWLAQARPLYDPAQVLARLGRIWDGLPASAWASVRAQQFEDVAQQLAASEPGALPALLLMRRLARENLLPALVGPRPMPLGGWRLPHHWHAQFALTAPRTVALLDRLYGFNGPDEAARVLKAMRGLGMLGLERQARVAVQAGYWDGAVRLIRDETAALHHADIGRWTQLAPARRERLSVLLGLERSPLGTAALEVGAELLEAVRLEVGRG